MGRPRSSTFYLPLAPMDAPLSLKAKLSVLPPQAANALLAPRQCPSLNDEDECTRLERVLGCSTVPRNPRATSESNRPSSTSICEPLREATINPTCAPFPTNHTEFGAEPTISEGCRQVTLEECAAQTGSSCADVISPEPELSSSRSTSTSSTQTHTQTTVAYLPEFDYIPSESSVYMDGAELSPCEGAGTLSEEELQLPITNCHQHQIDLEFSNLPPLPPSPPPTTTLGQTILSFSFCKPLSRTTSMSYSRATRPRLPSKLSICLSINQDEELEEECVVENLELDQTLPCEQLDTRAYLKPECRLPCPPPPPSLLLAIASNTAASRSTADAPCQRQRYRTALPLYKRVLRRSMGSTAWEREEYLRAARSLDDCENGDDWWYDGTTPGVEFCGGGTFWECDEEEDDECCDIEDADMHCDQENPSQYLDQPQQQEFGVECGEDDRVLFDQDTEMVDTCWEREARNKSLRGYREDDDVDVDVFRYSLRDEPSTQQQQQQPLSLSNSYTSYSHSHQLQQPQPLYVQPDCGVDMFYAAAGFLNNDSDQDQETTDDDEDSPISEESRQQQQIPEEVSLEDIIEEDDYFDPESQMDTGMVDDLEGMVTLGDEHLGIRFIEVPASPLVESFMESGSGVDDEDESSSTSTSRPTSPDSHALQQPQPSSPPPPPQQPPVLLAPAPKPWAFASLRNAVSSLVSIARSRSPSPLPWLRRSRSPLEDVSSSSTSSGNQLSGSSGDETPKSRPVEHHHTQQLYDSQHFRHPLRIQTDTNEHSEGEEEYPTSITPTPGTPPKRTLSTSSLSSIVSSEGSSGVGSCTTSACGSDIDLDDESVGARRFGSRSSSPSPVCRTVTPVMVWDPSYSPSMLSPGSWKSSATLLGLGTGPIGIPHSNSHSVPTSPLSTTPRENLALALAGGRRSPMPGSWDPFDVWEVDDRF